MRQGALARNISKLTCLSKSSENKSQCIASIPSIQFQSMFAASMFSPVLYLEVAQVHGYVVNSENIILRDFKMW